MVHFIYYLNMDYKSYSNATKRDTICTKNAVFTYKHLNLTFFVENSLRARLKRQTIKSMDSMIVSPTPGCGTFSSRRFD